MAGTDDNDPPVSDVLEQGSQDPGWLESLGRLRGVRLAASGLLASAAIGWVLLGPGVAGLTPSSPPADEGATTGKARSEPASSVVPSTEGGHRCEHERGGGARTGYARDGGEGRATARSRSIAGSLYRFARAPAAGERVRWARDVALTAPTARLVVRRDQTTTREAWTTEAGPAGDYLLADLAARVATGSTTSATSTAGRGCGPRPVLPRRLGSASRPAARSAAPPGGRWTSSSTTRNPSPASA